MPPASPPLRPLLSVVTPAYNEEENVEECYRQVAAVFAALPQYRHEHLFIDNCSKDGTVAVLRRLAAQDKRVKVIVNARNFGHLRSPFHGLLQARGAAAILFVADLQDPAEVIPKLLARWEEGFKLVQAVKEESEESALMFWVRKTYYKMLATMADIELTKNTTGFGLYDRKILDVLAQMTDPIPYLRGLVSEIGFPKALVPYRQPVRKRGFTKNNFYSLYDTAMLGFTNHSKVPLRLATFVGMGTALFCLLIAFGYLAAKLLFWNSFVIGSAPSVVGTFFLGAVQLFFIGVIGEYVGAVHTLVLQRPRVIEAERINFDVAEETAPAPGEPK